MVESPELKEQRKFYRETWHVVMTGYDKDEKQVRVLTMGTMQPYNLQVFVENLKKVYPQIVKVDVEIQFRY